MMAIMIINWLWYIQAFVGLWRYYFKHAVCKTCQYVTNDDKVSTSLTLVNMKDVQTSLKIIIFWTKKPRKGRHEWEKACIKYEMWHWKLKTNENKVCEQNYNVWWNFGIQTNHFVMLWEAKDINFVGKNPYGPSANNCKSCHSLLDSCGDNMCDEPIWKPLVIINCFNYYNQFNCGYGIWSRSHCQWECNIWPFWWWT